MADEVGSIGEAFLEIRARVDKQSVAQETEKAQTEAQRKLRKQQGTIESNRQMESAQRRHDEARAEKERLFPELGHFYPGAQSRVDISAAAGAARLREQIAARQSGREQDKTLADKLAKESRDFSGNLEKSNKGFAESFRLIEMARGALPFAGGVVAGAAGVATLAAAKLYGDSKEYAKASRLASPALDYHRSQLDRDIEGVKGRGSVASEWDKLKRERETADMREFLRQETAAGRAPPAWSYGRFLQNWQTSSNAVGGLWSRFEHWALGADQLPDKARKLSLGAGGYEGLGQHFGGPMELIQAAQSAASQSYRAGDSNTAAMEANTEALTWLGQKIQEAGGVREGTFGRTWGPVVVEPQIGPN